MRCGVIGGALVGRAVPARRALKLKIHFAYRPDDLIDSEGQKELVIRMVIEE
jgi:hypothetical protein